LLNKNDYICSQKETIKSYNKNLEKLVAEKTKLLSKSKEKYRTLYDKIEKYNPKNIP